MNDFALLNEKSAIGLIGNPKVIIEDCNNWGLILVDNFVSIILFVQLTID